MKKITVQFECGELAVKISGNSKKAVAKERQAFLDYARQCSSVKKAGFEAAHPQPDTAEGQKVVRTAAENMSWYEIKESIENGDDWKVGDTVDDVLATDEKVTFVVTQVTDDFVRFESRDCVGEESIEWNESGSTEGGFENSDAIKFLENTVWGYLPDELKRVISSAERKYIDTDGEIKTFYPLLFLPSAAEVFDRDDCYGDKKLYEQLDYYKDRRNRMRGKTKGEDTCSWWLASAYSGDSAAVCYVYDAGYAYYYDACSTLRVPVCFHIARR
jgi:hypothetical protein